MQRRERGRDELIAVDFQSSEVLSPRPCCYRGELLSPLLSWVKEGGPRALLPPQKSVLMGAEENKRRERKTGAQSRLCLSLSAFSVFFLFKF